MGARKPACIAAALFAISLSVAACSSSGGSSSTTTPTGTSSVSAGASGASGGTNATAGHEVSASLISEAKKEGTVVVLATLPTATFQAVAQAFKADYGINVAYTKGPSSGPIMQSSGQQMSAGNVQDDVVGFSPDPAWLTKYQSDLATLSKTTMPNLAAMPSDEVSPTWVDYELQYYGFVYNTNLIPSSSLPKTMADLATEPALKGKLATTDPADATSFATWWAMMRQHLGTAGWEKWMSELFGTQQLQVGEDASEQIQEVGSGEIGMIGPTNYGQMASLKQSGAPVNITYLNPVMSLPETVVIPAKAPHLAAAELFVNWLMGPQAQGIICGKQQAASYLNIPDAIQKPAGMSIVPAPLPLGDTVGPQVIIPYFKAHS
jgi:iron(III) transport system substrate-binding protein